MIFGIYKDIFLLKFPIYLPLIYGIILYLYPEYDYILAFLTLALLAEPHFGATWPFLLDKVNHNKLAEDRVIYLYFPIIITFLSIIFYFNLNPLFYLIFFSINVYHVTKQSFGVAKLYIKNLSELKYQQITIYTFSFIFFAIGILRFYLNLITYDQSMIVFYILSVFLSISILLYFLLFGFKENVLTMITGSIIFAPMCFINKPIHGIVMGVTMHYIQYLALTYKVSTKRKLENNKSIRINYSFIFINS